MEIIGSDSISHFRVIENNQVSEISRRMFADAKGRKVMLCEVCTEAVLMVIKG